MSLSLIESEGQTIGVISFPFSFERIRQDLLSDLIGCLQVWVIVCMNNPGDADELLTFDLPILKKMGAQVYSKCKSIRPASCWVDDLKKLVPANEITE